MPVRHRGPTVGGLMCNGAQAESGKHYASMRIRKEV